ncbi:MAG TPA: catalase, partial [Coriobacteriia bacterium]
MSESGRTTPSTTWTETIPDDEAERFASYARELSEVQRRKNERYGVGRTLHRKQLLGLAATLDVLPDLPEHAA